MERKEEAERRRENQHAKLSVRCFKPVQNPLVLFPPFYTQETRRGHTAS